jgi:hypothetical protein
MSKYYKVADVTEAIALAQDLQIKGKYDLFRGQTCNWRIASSVTRLGADEVEKANNQLK